MQASSTAVISGRVLFVDDEVGILSALKRVFRRESYEIETAQGGAAGLEVFRRFRPAVVISDYRMPGMSGVEFLAKARAIDPETVRLMLTGCTDLPAAEAAINQGEVWRFLTKPWDEGDLRDTVASANERFRLVAENRVLLDKLAAIGLLAGGVAHELNNPIGGILAYAQLLRREVDPESASIVADLKSIEDAALRAKRIVSDLLDFARSSKTMERSPVTLTSVAEKAVALSKFQLRDIRIEVEAGEPTQIVADANRLQQVVLNLLSNALDAVAHARKAGKSSSRVVVRTWKSGGDACLSVTDDGSGIPPEARARVFDAFFTTKEPGKGTGLGLAVSTGIVRDHGGRLELSSMEDESTTFTVSIPALPESTLRVP